MEIWKDVIDYEGLYEMSNLGSIRSQARTGTKGGILKQKLSNTGYWSVRLSKNGTVRSNNVHRIFAKLFIPNPENKPCINHKDGVKSNNDINNLEWCTYKENTAHAIDAGLQTPTHMNLSNVCGKNHPKSKTTYQYDSSNNKLRSFDSRKEASETTGVAMCSISQVCNGKIPFAGGYIWKNY